LPPLQLTIVSAQTMARAERNRFVRMPSEEQSECLP
jgi:hypothetical protein